MASLVAHGGNSFRTWRFDNRVDTGKQVLDRALENGVMVSMCLELRPERRGFDYSDEDAVAAQLRSVRNIVQRYREHPALLTWIIGNEMNFDFKNPAVYDAVNGISKMIHEVDPHHPTTTTIAGLDAETVALIHERAPDLDFLSFQVYGELAILPKFIEEIGYDRPFFVTEWGAIGHWEMPKTEWGAPIEQTSTEKANNYLRGYRERIEPLSHLIIGNYVFLWEQKQEKTPTWFGMFLESGEETETVDVMHYVWNGEWPKNRTPAVTRMQLDGKTKSDNVRLRAGKTYRARLDAKDPDGDGLTYSWEVKRESTSQQVGGDPERSIESLKGLIKGRSKAKIQLRAPKEPGAYRLFVYAFDGHNHAAHANIPFFVER